MDALSEVGCRLTPAGKTFDSANCHIFLFLLFHCKSWTKQPWIFFFSAVLPLCDSRSVRRSYAPTTFPTRQAIVATPRGNPSACPPVMTRRYHLSTRSSGENGINFIVYNRFPSPSLTHFLWVINSFIHWTLEGKFQTFFF